MHSHGQLHCACDGSILRGKLGLVVTCSPPHPQFGNKNIKQWNSSWPEWINQQVGQLTHTLAWVHIKMHNCSWKMNEKACTKEQPEHTRGDHSTTLFQPPSLQLEVKDVWSRTGLRPTQELASRRGWKEFYFTFEGALMLSIFILYTVCCPTPPEAHWTPRYVLIQVGNVTYVFLLSSDYVQISMGE